MIRADQIDDVKSGTSADAPAIDSAAPGVLTVDLSALVANWKRLESRGVPAECAAVVKADAYGCGLSPVTRALYGAGCKTFFVATPDEAKAARAVAPSATIYVLDGFFGGAGEAYAKIDARPVIGGPMELAEWDAFRATHGWQGGCAIHVDTGMNRLGFTPSEAAALTPRLNQTAHGINLVMSHLACAEMPAHALNARQVAAFREIAHGFPGITASLANSSGIFLGPSAFFDMTRPGAALYGVNPTPDEANPMEAVVEVKARILQVRDVERGASVGYGATWSARRPTRLAILAAGYADGYFRAAGAADGVRGADVLIARKRYPLAGRVSMDLIAVDVTDAPVDAVRRGQFATLIGERLPVDELARPFGTIGYEVLTSLGRRYQRIYRGA